MLWTRGSAAGRDAEDQGITLTAATAQRGRAHAATAPLELEREVQHDPSAEVRRALLLNLPFTPGTLPFLLERARAAYESGEKMPTIIRHLIYDIRYLASRFDWDCKLAIENFQFAIS